MRKAFILVILLPFLLVTLMASAVLAGDTLFVFEGSDRLLYFDKPGFNDIFSKTCITKEVSLSVFIAGWDLQNVIIDDFLFYGGLGGVGDILGLPNLYG